MVDKTGSVPTAEKSTEQSDQSLTPSEEIEKLDLNDLFERNSNEKRPVPPDLNGSLVMKMAFLGSTYEEIGFITCVDKDVVRQRFKGEYDRGKTIMKIRLRRAQLQNAVDKMSAPMQRWLGIQYLEQKDAVDVSSDTITESYEQYLERVKKVNEKDVTNKLDNGGDSG